MTDSDNQAMSLQHKDAGNKCMADGNISGAIEEYTLAIEQDPTNHIFFSNRCAAYMKNSTFDLALEDAKECVKLNPTWVKGFVRLVQAYLALDMCDEALEAVAEGQKQEADNNMLKALNKEALRKKGFLLVKGKWNGKVDEAMGGYVQILDFINDKEMILQVIDRTLPVAYEINVEADPMHLDLTIVPQPGQPPSVIKHIFKVEGDVMHLCAPFMKPPDERPTEFGGPALVLMQRGGPNVSEDEKMEQEAVAKMTDDEKYESFCKSLAEALPEDTVFDREEGDSDTVLAQKWSKQVKFQSRHHAIGALYGQQVEEYIRKCLVYEVTPAPAVGAAVDLLRERMVKARLIDPITKPGDAKPAAAAAPVSTETKPTAKPAEKAVEVPAKAEPATKELGDGDDKSVGVVQDDMTLPLVVGVLSAIAAIGLGVFLLKRK